MKRYAQRKTFHILFCLMKIGFFLYGRTCLFFGTRRLASLQKDYNCVLRIEPNKKKEDIRRNKKYGIYIIRDTEQRKT